MKKSFIMILVVLLVASSATAAFAAEEPSIHLFGNYTIQEDGLICYTIQMLGNPICYLGFTIDSDLEIIEVQTENTAFSAAHYASNKVICYGMGDVIADYSMVITLILAAPEPNRFYSISLSDIEGYTLREEQMTISVAMPVIEIAQETPPAPMDPKPTEPAPTEPKPTKPAPTEPANTKPSDPEVNTAPQSSTKPQSGNSGNANIPAAPQGDGEIIDMNQIDSVKAGHDGFLSKIDTLVQRNPPAFWGITTGLVIFFVIVLATRDGKDKKDGEK